MQLSERWRKRGNRSQLLLSFIEPHLPVASATFARWIKEVLSLAGIDTNIFKSHSVRSASTSKAKALGLTTKDILAKGNWSTESTWQKFYNKDIKGKDQIYQESILKGRTL